MKHEAEITSVDGVNVYIRLKVKAKLAGKISMSIIMLLLLGLLGLVFANIDPSAVGKALVPAFILILIIIVGPARYLLWNLYGEERILINTKVICWQYSYGIFDTHRKQVEFKLLGSGFNTCNMFDGTEHGTLVFFDYNAKTRTPQTVFETTIFLPKNKLIEIDEAISQIFDNEHPAGQKFIPFSLN